MGDLTAPRLTLEEDVVPDPHPGLYTWQGTTLAGEHLVVLGSLSSNS